MTRWTAGIPVVAFALALVACNPAPPDEGRREASLPPPPPPPMATPVRPPSRAIWAFDNSSDQCSARAAAGGLSLLATVRRDTPIRMTIVVPAELPAQSTSVRLGFTGNAGRWQVTGQRIGGHQILVILGSDEAALSRVLVLLRRAGPALV